METSIGTTGLNRLSQSTVGIVGLGSLGSQVAVLLGMSGIGNFILIDPDVLEEHNVVRHAADLRYVHLSKVEAVGQLLRARNETCIVSEYEVDALENTQHLSRADLVIVAGLGSEIATATLAASLRELGKPALFGGIYEKGIAGECFFVNPNADGPCYACFASLLRDATPPSSTPVLYGMAPDEVKAQAGLGVHVSRVATVVADWAIRLFINDKNVLRPFPTNLVILANEEYELGRDAKNNPVILPPQSARWLPVKKDPSCLVCGKQEAPSESIDELLESS